MSTMTPPTMTMPTDDVDGGEPLDTILTLPMGMSAADIARSCRSAALELVNESKHWGKAELAMWLSGTYAMLTKHADNSVVRTLSKPPVFPVPLLRDLDARLIDRILESARKEILETLAGVARDGSASFALRALISGSVVRCDDSFNEPAWAPTSEPSRLADRVLSLFAVDYFARPADYETELFICSMCSTVSFDASVRKLGVCHQHSNVQNVSHRPAPRFTLPYPGLGA